MPKALPAVDVGAMALLAVPGTVPVWPWQESRSVGVLPLLSQAP